MKSGIHPFFVEISKYDTKVFIDAFSKLNYQVYKNRLESGNTMLKIGNTMLKIDLRKYNIWNTKSPTLYLVHWMCLV